MINKDIMQVEVDNATVKDYTRDQTHAGRNVVSATSEGISPANEAKRRD
jgi:hypothetical protein